MEATTQALEKETVVAVLPEKAKSDETELSRSVTAIELEAESILVESDGDYDSAAEFGSKLKNASAEVVAFFRPMKEAAHKAHREVCDREKIMLAPLLRAEKTLKQTMGAYALRKEQERKALEAEARRLAQEEADRKLAEAIAHEEQGDSKAAASAMIDATMADQMSRTMAVVSEAPKASKASIGRDWEIESIDPAKVPVSFVGIELRPVDEKAVLRLIRSSKGKIAIPGVAYRETAKVSIRR